jgi:ABC-2 type transport system ATP-binding protein
MFPDVTSKESGDRSTADQVLKIDRVSNRYGDVVALHDLSFSVRGREVFGFVGSNGAGKTTTMRIVMGVLAADVGEVHWQGRPLSFETRRHFGYMPEERGLYLRMRVREQLIYLAELHGRSTAEAERGTDAWLAHLDLTGRAHDEVQALSHGNQQRVQLAAALVFTPDLLLLDEPFAGLDPVAVDVLSGVLRQQAEAGLPARGLGWGSGAACGGRCPRRDYLCQESRAPPADAGTGLCSRRPGIMGNGGRPVRR